MSRNDSPINFSSSTSDEWYLTGVQLEVGEKATPFEHRSFGDELAKCQRYYQLARGGQAFTGTERVQACLSTAIGLKTEMRAAPTVTLNSVKYTQNTGTTSPNYANTDKHGTRFVWTPTNSSASELHILANFDAEL